MKIEIDAVLFDSDGVLVDSHHQVHVAWTQLCDEFGLDVASVTAEFTGKRAIDTLRNYVERNRLAAALDRLEDLEVEGAAGTPPVPGAIDLTQSLPDGAWTIATSATRRLALARWAAAGIPVPARTTTAEDVANGKPHPDPYLHAAAHLGVDPTRCLVFEDADSGGRAGVAAGAQVIAVGDQPWSFEPLARIPDLRSVTVEASNPLTLRIDAAS